ncbi:hypothetical protein K456DRAFT_983743 [Colletotrichum gloeosporioides 23]|nr:hypothetical protein K456DRAFT_983743 [Colletotrichum gloeosporioides 23]
MGVAAGVLRMVGQWVWLDFCCERTVFLGAIFVSIGSASQDTSRNDASSSSACVVLNCPSRSTTSDCSDGGNLKCQHAHLSPDVAHLGPTVVRTTLSLTHDVRGLMPVTSMFTQLPVVRKHLGTVVICFLGPASYARYSPAPAMCDSTSIRLLVG